MDIETFKAGLQAVNLIGTFGLGCWLYLEKRSDKTNEEVKTLANKVDQIDKDVASLTAASGVAPSHDDLANVYRTLNAQAETLNRLVGETEGQSATLRLILNQIVQKGLQ